MKSLIANLTKNNKNVDLSKFLIICVLYFCVIGSYTIIKEIQNTVFIKTVGVELIPIAKTATTFVLVPAILIYSFLVDKLRRFQIVFAYAAIYGTFILLFGLLIHHLDISNVKPMWGWAFYFFIEGFSPFVLSLFWSLFNGITSTDNARKQYSLIVASGKLGGVITSGGAWWVLSHVEVLSSDAMAKIMYVSGAMLLCTVPILVYLRKISENKVIQQKEAKETKEKTGIWIGFKLLFQNRYVLGIFMMVFCYEILNQLLSYQRLLAANDANTNTNQLAAMLFSQVFYLHFVGLIVSLVGSNFIFRWFSQRNCIIMTPALVAVIVLIYILCPQTVVFAYLSVHILGICLAWPVRETLYIITIKDIQFKSKSWIDGFGTKIAKTCGQQLNMFFNIANKFSGATMGAIYYNAFLVFLIIVWIGSSVMLANIYEKNVKKGTLIGK